MTDKLTIKEQTANIVLNDNKELVKKADTYLVKAEKGLAIWNRSHSNLAWDLLTIGTHPTKTRQIRQVSAQLNKTKQALIEAEFNLREKKAKANVLFAKAEAITETDPVSLAEKELLYTRAEKAAAMIQTVKAPYEAALKDVCRLGKDYAELEEQIIAKYGKFDEEIFENEEKEYWMKRLFSQAYDDMTASGRISSANTLCLRQIGFDPLIVTGLLGDFIVVKDTKAHEDVNNGGVPDASIAMFEKALDEWYNAYKYVLDDKYTSVGLSDEIDKSVMLIDEQSIANKDDINE